MFIEERMRKKRLTWIPYAKVMEKRDNLLTKLS